MLAPLGFLGAWLVETPPVMQGDRPNLLAGRALEAKAARRSSLLQVRALQWRQTRGGACSGCRGFHGGGCACRGAGTLARRPPCSSRLYGVASAAAPGVWGSS